MATYAELLSATENTALFNRVRVAVTIAAEKVRVEDPPPPNHDARLAWARLVFDGPDAQAKKMIHAVIAQNSTATLAQITGASDATVQTAVDAAVDVFAI